MVSLLILVTIVLFYFVGAGFKESKQIQLISLGSDIFRLIPEHRFSHWKTFCRPRTNAMPRDEDYAERLAEWRTECDAFESQWKEAGISGQREIIAANVEPSTIAADLSDDIGHIVWMVLFAIMWVFVEFASGAGLLALFEAIAR